jgi:hypothetical protein
LTSIGAQMQKPDSNAPIGWRRVLLLSHPANWVTASLLFLVGLWHGGSVVFHDFAALAVYFSLPYGHLAKSANLLANKDSKLQANHWWQGLTIASLIFTAGIVVASPPAARWWLLGLVIALAVKPYCHRLPGIDLLIAGWIGLAPFGFGLLLANALNWPWSTIVAICLWAMARQLFGSIRFLPQAVGTASKLGISNATWLALAMFVGAALLLVLAYGWLGLVIGSFVALFALNAATFLKYAHTDNATQFARGWQNQLWLELLVGFWLALVLTINANPFFMTPTEGLAAGAYLLCLISGVSLAITISNLRYLQPVPMRLDKAPKVSVLIPARNEADIIATTVNAALSQDYPNFEVMVLNDRSTDKTIEAVRPLLAAGAKLLQGETPPPGWTGKNYACYQLASIAQGDYLLFLDADCVLHPEALSRLMGQAQLQKLELVSLIPGDFHQSRLETVVMPMAHVITLAFQPLAWIVQKHRHYRPDPGICQMFQRAAYDRIGGHAKARQSITGIDLAVNIPLERYRLLLEPGLASCRHYRTTDELLSGQVRRLYPMLGYSLPLVAALFSGGLAYTLGPWLIFVNAIPSGPIGLAFLAVILPLASRFSIMRRMDEPLGQILLYPAAMPIQLLLLPISFWRYEFGRVNWKGSRLLLRRQIKTTA